MPSTRGQIIRALGLTLLLLSGLVAMNPAQASLEAVELTNVPTHIGSGCNRTFFKSSNSEENVLYVTPQVLAGRSPVQGAPKEIDIYKTSNPGQYLLAVGLFFPRENGSNNNFYEKMDAQGKFCDFDEIMEDLNSLIDDKDKQYDRVDRLPLTSIDVSIPALDNLTATIGRIEDTGEGEEADLLEYVDSAYTAHFLIDETQLKLVQTLMAREYVGLQLDVRFRFQSRRNDGEVIISLDASEMEASFRAQFAARKKFVGRAEAKAALQAAIATQTANIQVKAGNSESSNRAIQQILDRVLQAIPFDNDPINLDPVEFSQSPENKNSLASIDIAAQALVSFASSDFRYHQTTTNQNTTVSVPVRVESQVEDPMYFDVELKDGWNPKHLPIVVKAGQSFEIAPQHENMVDRVWGTKESNITLDQFDALGILQAFPEFRDSTVKFEDEEKDEWMNKYTPVKSCNRFGMGCSTFKVIRRQTYPVEEHNYTHVYYDLDKVENLDRVPMLVAFSRVGAGSLRYSLKELVEAHSEYFSAELINGVVRVTALKDLGYVRVSDTFVKYSPKSYGAQVTPKPKCTPEHIAKGETWKCWSRLQYSIHEQFKAADVSQEMDEANSQNKVYFYDLHTGNKTADGYPLADLSFNKSGSTGEFLFSYVADVVNMDEAFVDLITGSGNRLDQDDDGNDISKRPIRNRVDYDAIMRYRSLYVKVSTPYIIGDRTSIIDVLGAAQRLERRMTLPDFEKIQTLNN